MHLELVVSLVCLTILFLATILVFSEYISYYLIGYSFPHPQDFIAHFVTCLAGVLFFTIFLTRFNYGRTTSLVIGIIVMAMVSLFKEFFLDPSVSLADLLFDLFGIIFAAVLIFNHY